MVNTINNIETHYFDRHCADSCMTIPVIISWSMSFTNLSKKAALLNIMNGFKNPWVVSCVYTFKLGTMHGKRVFRFRNVKKMDCSQTTLWMSWQLLRKHNNVETRYQQMKKMKIIVWTILFKSDFISIIIIFFLITGSKGIAHLLS